MAKPLNCVDLTFDWFFQLVNRHIACGIAHIQRINLRFAQAQLNSFSAAVELVVDWDALHSAPRRASLKPATQRA